MLSLHVVVSGETMQDYNGIGLGVSFTTFHARYR